MWLGARLLLGGWIYQCHSLGSKQVRKQGFLCDQEKVTEVETVAVKWEDICQVDQKVILSKVSWW